MLSDESTAKFEIELVNKQVQKIKQAKKDCQTHYGKQLGCGTCKALQLCMWIDELVDTIEAMQKHIEALQQENEQLQEFANVKQKGGWWSCLARWITKN
jgi:prefoldin subunit 5